MQYIFFQEFCSLRSKRFREVWEQRKTQEQNFRYFACAENGARAPFIALQFFASEPHKNACYAG